MMDIRIAKPFAFTIRLLATLVVGAILLYLANRAIVPSGRLTVETDLVHPAPFVSQPKPSDRIAEVVVDGHVMQAVVGHPLYIDLIPPSQFESIVMTLKYRNSGQSLVELGALGSALEQQFFLKPAEHGLLDRLAWAKVQSGDITLYQRNDTYSSVDDLFRNPPSPRQVATYMIRVRIPYRLPGYEARDTSRTIRASLRGHHRMWTYVKDETLQFTFSVQDMNRQEGADPVILSLYGSGDGGDAIARTVLLDDGNTTDDQRSSKLRILSIMADDLPEGAYQLEFTAPGDIFIREILTTQQKLVFEGKVYLGDHVGYSDVMDPISVFSSGSMIVMRTAHAESFQTIGIEEAGGLTDQVILDEVHTRYIRRYPVDAAPRRITSPRRDVLIESDGLFAFSSDEFFDPMPFAIEWYTDEDDLDTLGIDFVLVDYEPPVKDGETNVVTAVFDVDTLDVTEDGAYRFVIAAPGIGERGHELRIESLAFTMQREPLTVWNAVPRFFGLFTASPEASERRVLTGGATYGEALP